MVDTLEVDDPEQRFAAVRLCSDLPLPERDFVRGNGSWVMRLPDNGLARLEYQLELLDHDGNAHVVCDPDNPRRAPGAFGEKSVLWAADYQPPAWLEEPRVQGTVEQVGIRVLGRPLEIGVWSPGDGELPMLVAHDGPEYAELAGLTRYAGVMIERGALPPFRVALLPPGDRNEWYSASAVYGRALASASPAFRLAWERASGGWRCSRPSGPGPARLPACFCNRRASSCPAMTAKSPGFRATGGSHATWAVSCAPSRALRPSRS
jgi:enterochelin esterase family protein